MSLELPKVRELIRAARKEAEKIGKPMTVCIVDDGGYVISLDRMPGARKLTPSIALSKAYSAAIMARPTNKLRGFAEHEASLFAQIGRMGHQPVVACDGGLPIMKDGVVIGGIGTSGGSGPEDEQVALSALSAGGFQTEF